MTLRHRAWSGRSVAWYARLLGVQEVVSSNLTAPTIVLADLTFRRQFSSVVEQRFCKPSVVGSNPTTASIFAQGFDRIGLSNALAMSV